MEKKETKIEKLVLSIGGKEMTVSIEDAKKLHEALKELFGSSTTYTTYPIFIDRPVYPYQHWKPYYYSNQSGNINCSSSYQNTNTLEMKA